MTGDGQTEAEGVPSQGGRSDVLLRRMPPYLTRRDRRPDFDEGYSELLHEPPTTHYDGKLGGHGDRKKYATNMHPAIDINVDVSHGPSLGFSLMRRTSDEGTTFKLSILYARSRAFNS